MVEHINDYTTIFLDLWDFEFRGRTSLEEEKRQEKQARTG